MFKLKFFRRFSQPGSREGGFLGVGVVSMENVSCKCSSPVSILLPIMPKSILSCPICHIVLWSTKMCKGCVLLLFLK